MTNNTLPDLGAIVRSINVKIPDRVDIDLPTQHMWSDTQFEIIQKYIREFEASLDDEHEVAVKLSNFGQSILIQVTHIRYEKSVLLIFQGLVDGKHATLIQHINQLNFLLMAIPKVTDKPKKPIGFSVPDNK